MTPRTIAAAVALTLAPLPAHASTWKASRSHSSPMRGRGLCHAAVDAVAPPQLRSYFHQIVRRESGDDPGAWYRNTNGSIDRGCLQINSIHRIPASCLFDAACNIRTAVRLYHRAGSSPWRTSRSDR